LKKVFTDASQQNNKLPLEEYNRLM